MKILMVCLGNICRSPLAEGILQKYLGTKHTVSSCGTAQYHIGEQPDHRSIEVAKNHQIDISNQKAQQLDSLLIEEYDLIFAMDEQNRKDILKMCTSDLQKQKVYLLLEETNHSTLKNVPDPYYGTLNDFEKVYQILDNSLQVVAQKIINGNS